MKRIRVDKRENRLTLFEDGRVVKVYRVATGKDPKITPEGMFSIIFKTKNPPWTNTRTGEVIPGGAPNNPLGTRWLGLSVGEPRGREYGIHGTNHPESIGQHITLGCVRMRNEDVEELYDQVPLGTMVTITPA